MQDITHDKPIKNEHRFLSVSDLKKVHLRGETEVPALRGVSCQFEKGSFNFILGPSGSGKSSLLYLLGALDDPTDGEIQFAGQSLSSFTEDQRDHYRREQVGFIFQSFNLLKTLNAVDNVLVPFLPQGINAELRDRAIDLLTQVGLGHRLDHHPHHLSGGEQQRVAIARALLKKPELVLADEPTGELDSESGAEVFRYLRKLHDEQQTTVIVVTHDERYLENADRLLHLADGKLLREEIHSRAID
ncbi:MAG: ABC transporter ATP-binding protein [Planctomycetaceae bacterium]|nr:ABC transporter ATP-binding protein [Planctomycetaceae bacterium]